VYQSQNFHTANYRGNQQGHDNYLRADSQSPSSSFGASSFGGTQNVTSQYRGFQKPFQPTGFVNSVYGQQSSNTGFSNNQNQSQFTNAQSYHTANYRGDQQGHDSYLREDSGRPAQSQFGGSSLTGSSFGSSFGTTSPSIGSSFGVGSSFAPTTSSFGGQNQGQFASTQSYHTANYRGDQQGHDSYLRDDSGRPAQSQFGGASSNSFGTSNFGTGSMGSTSFGTSSFGATSPTVGSSFGSYGMQNQQNQGQFTNAQSYHTANYRGDQQGHDSYLREDSGRPAQSQFGSSSFGSNNSFNNRGF